MGNEDKDINLQKEKLTYYKALNDIANQIHSAQNINEILINLKDQFLEYKFTETEVRLTLIKVKVRIMIWLI